MSDYCLQYKPVCFANPQGRTETTANVLDTYQTVSQVKVNEVTFFSLCRQAALKFRCQE